MWNIPDFSVRSVRRLAVSEMIYINDFNRGLAARQLSRPSKPKTRPNIQCLLWVGQKAKFRGFERVSALAPKANTPIVDGSHVSWR